MNILMMTTHLNAGGITRYLYTLAKGMIQQGDEIHVLSAGGNAQDQFERIGVRLLTMNIRTKSELSPKLYFSLGKIKDYVEEHHIDLIHSQTRITQVMGRLASRPFGIPYVATCHGYFKVRLSRRFAPCWGDRVIAISQAVADHLNVDFGVPEDRIVKIVNGIDLEDFPLIEESLRETTRQELGYQEDDIVIGQLARLSEVKGQDVLIRAMAKVVREIPTARLLLVGQGKTEPLLRHLIEDLKLTSSVRIEPVVHEPKRFLAAMDLFAMPSRQEGLGISVMEAQSSGLPVVASRVGGLPSLIVDGKTGFLTPPENSVVLSEVLIRLIKDLPYAREVGRRSRKFIIEKHSAEDMVNRTRRLFARLIRKADLE